MKRAIAVAVLAAAIFVPAGSRAATTVPNFRLIGAYYSQGPDVISVAGLVSEDLSGNGTPYLWGQAYMQTASGTNSGTGVLDVTLDPTMSIGKLSGTIVGNLGPITVDVTYFGTSISTYYPPGAYLDVNPFNMTLSGAYFWNRTGHAQASLASSVGTITTDLAAGNSNYGLGVSVS